jgi:hypothetical protein
MQNSRPMQQIPASDDAATNILQYAHNVINFTIEEHKLEHRKECGTQGVTGNLFRGCGFLY